MDYFFSARQINIRRLQVALYIIYSVHFNKSKTIYILTLWRVLTNNSSQAKDEAPRFDFGDGRTVGHFFSSCAACERQDVRVSAILEQF